MLLDGTDLLGLSQAAFVENAGQWTDSAVRYGLQGGATHTAVLDDGLAFSVATGGEGDGFDVVGFRSRFVDANAVVPVGLDARDTAYHFFVGDPANWRTGVSGYSAVAYESLWAGVDLHLAGGEPILKQEFDVAAGGDWSAIAVAYEGVDALAIDAEGNLEITTEAGVLEDAAPVIWQEIDGQQVFVEGAYRLIDAQTYGFTITGTYDPAYGLTIDPTLTWTTYVGDSTCDTVAGMDVAADPAGAVYVTGTAYINGGSTLDVFVAKLAAEGGEAVYFAWMGGTTGNDEGKGIAVDSDGRAYVTGGTASDDWAGGGYGGGPRDAFVAILDTGGDLLCSTYLGGAGDDLGNDIAIVEDGGTRIFVVGQTMSDWIDPGTLGGMMDAFVAELAEVVVEPDVHLALQAATNLGGDGIDFGLGIALDDLGGVYVAGSTTSLGLATDGAPDGDGDLALDGFAAKLDNSLSSVLYFTYLGGGSIDLANDIAVDDSGSVFVTGVTHSDDLPTTEGALAEEFLGGTNDAFVAKLVASPTATTFTYLTYLGGSGDDLGNAIAVDSSGNALVAGTTSSEGWSTTGGFGGAQDAFVAQLDPTGSELLYAQYLGGANNDIGNGLALDLAGNILVTGQTQSEEWIDGSLNGTSDAFVAKIGVAQPITSGQTATVGFWMSRSQGQALLNELNDGPESTQLGDWLAATFPNLFGVNAGLNDLTGKTNAEVASFYRGLMGRSLLRWWGAVRPRLLEVRVLAVALSVYVTNETLADTTAQAYGFVTSPYGLGASTFNVGDNGDAFGVDDDTNVTVLDLLLASNERAFEGLLHDADESGTIDSSELSMRRMANQAYLGIIRAGL